MHLRIKPFNALIKDMYNGHGHFHEGDAGIDLFIIEEHTAPIPCTNVAGTKI